MKMKDVKSSFDEDEMNGYLDADMKHIPDV
jgi:hypothetical protein